MDPASNTGEFPTSPASLGHLKVVEVGDFIAAPFCTKLFADLGAEVIKIEQPPAGDTARAYGPFPNDTPDAESSGLFLYLNTNKYGITVNLRTPTGQEILHKLLDQADLLIENVEATQVEAFGLDAQSLVERHPQLVVASISPFGRFGPKAGYRGYAITSCHASGVPNLNTGYPDREPLTFPDWQTHFHAAANAAPAALLALLARNRTGRGQTVDIAEGPIFTTQLMGLFSCFFADTGIPRVRTGHRTSISYPYTLLRCQDGSIELMALEERQWQNWLAVQGDPDWGKEEIFQSRFQRAKFADDLDSLQADWLMSHTKEEIFRRAQARAVPATPVYTVAEVAESPHLAERGYFVEVDHPVAGKVRLPGAPYQFTETPWAIRRPAPRLGEYNREVLVARLGYPAEHLPLLRRTGII